jgi:hypothetical protein
VTVKHGNITQLPSWKAAGAEVMAGLAPEQQELYALEWYVSRGDLPVAAQLKCDRFNVGKERMAAAVTGPTATGVIMAGIS